jgi:hypothetical protein
MINLIYNPQVTLAVLIVVFIIVLRILANLNNET